MHRLLAMCLSFMVLVIMAGSSRAFSEDKPTITWLALDWQPAWIEDGPWAGKGYAQVVEKMLQDRLPEYEHRSESSINVRLYSIIKNKEACFAAAPYQGIDLDDEKRQGLVFSAPTFLFLYHGLIARDDAAPVIAEHEVDGHVDFQALIKDNRVKGAFQPGRVYSRWLNNIFSKDGNVANMFRWSGRTDLTQSMFKMMDAGRFDFFVDYYLMLRFHELTEGNSSHYRFYPLLEHKDQFGLGGIACNDTPQGRDVIGKINLILKDLRKTDQFTNANAFWLMPSGQESKYWQLWHNELLARDD